MREIHPSEVISGLSVSEDEDATNDLDIVMDAGVYYVNAIEKHSLESAIYSRTTPMIKHYLTSGAWDSATSTEIDTANYNDGTNLVDLGVGKWLKSAFLYENDKIQWIYPTEYHDTEAQALLASLPTTPPGLAISPKVTALVYRTDDTDFTNATWQDVRGINGSVTFAGVTDHGSLSGLTDDDHTIYLLADGTRNLAGNWNLGGYNLTNGGALTVTSLTDGTLTMTGGDITGATNTNWDLAYAHISESGASHTYINQSVVSTATPTFAQLILSNAPTSATHATPKSYVDGLIQGLDWQESILDRYDPTGGLPGAPSTGDRYIATATANDWTDKYIYEYNGASWDETIPNEGYSVRVEDEDIQYTFNGTAWVKFSTTVAHNELSGLQGGTASEYYHLTNTEHGYISGANSQSLLTTASPTFNALSATSFGGITSANLVDKTATEAISGTWNFDTDSGNHPLYISRVGGTAQTLKIIVGDQHLTETYTQDVDENTAHYWTRDLAITDWVSGDREHQFKINGTEVMMINPSGIDVTGNITVSGTVDGIDIATDVAANTAKVTESTTATAPLVKTTYDISIPVATSGADGYLSSANWSTFNNKAEANQTMYIGTTGVAINRGSAALTLAGLTLTTPDIGTPSAGILTNCTFPTLNQNTTGSAATLTTARTIGGVNFDGSANIVPTTIVVADESVDTTTYIGYFTGATGNLLPKTGTNLTFNSATGILTSTGFAGALTGNVTGNVSGTSGSTTGNALTATTLQTARNINGVSFNGSANITVTADANTLSNTILKSTVVTSSLTSVGTIGTGVWQGTAIADGYIPNNITIDLASTATALAANGANCSAGSYPLGVNASGAVESCTDATTEINAVANALGGTNLTCSAQSCNVDDAFLKNNASDTMDAGDNTTLTILSNDAGESVIQLYGAAQGTGRLYVGQTVSYGGGFLYNGDGTPAFAGSAANDSVSFYRTSAGTHYPVFHYLHGDSTVHFADDIRLIGNAIQSSGSTDAITLSGANATVVGDLTIGDDILSVDCITFDSGGSICSNP